MSEILKKRLVGFLILISAGLILLPMFLAPNVSDRELQLQIDPRSPDLNGEAIAPILQDEIASLIEELDNTTRRTEPQLYEVDSWDLQVGSFERHANADSQVKFLREQGFSAYVRTGKNNGVRAFKVLVGPHIDLRQAEEIRSKLRESHQFRSLLIKHVPMATVLE